MLCYKCAVREIAEHVDVGWHVWIYVSLTDISSCLDVFCNRFVLIMQLLEMPFLLLRFREGELH